MRRWYSARPQERGQPLHHFAQERFAGQAVELRIPRRDQPDPETAGIAAVDVVGKTGEVVENDLGRAGLRPLQPVAQDPVAAGFRNQQEAIFRIDRNAIGEIQAFDDDCRLTAARVEGNDPPMPPVLENVEQARVVAAVPDPGTELGGRVRKIDDTLARDGEVVRVGKRFAVNLRQQVRDFAARRYPLDADVPVGNDQRSVRQGLDPERPAAGTGKLGDLPTVCLDAQDRSGRHRRVQRAVVADGDVFGSFVGAEVDGAGPGQGVVGGEYAGQAAILGRLPGHRIDRHRPGCEVQAGQ